ncbi:uncharacterized protein LOC34618870 [Cyclospora cayetanensis]|uniref:Uncharacterized protein LOC34618870 n=1 Tax=Cyclospora cayetanensis TaxID=88456 RepID=A0A6P6S3Z5_9EIME|nr:uncharacterized protein LOC34618870 [Cyclospora cayetanensis]
MHDSDICSDLRFPQCPKLRSLHARSFILWFAVAAATVSPEAVGKPAGQKSFRSAWKSDPRSDPVSWLLQHISDRELRRLQLPGLLSRLLPPPPPVEDVDSASGGSGSSSILPVQQQALVVRGVASIVLQQWLLLSADVLLLLRRLLHPEKQLCRRIGEHSGHSPLLGREQRQQDARRKRVRTSEVGAQGMTDEKDADEAAEVMLARAVALQQQQRQGSEEESQQRLRRLGSVFASHLQAAESCVSGGRDSSLLLLQRGVPDLFSACWATVSTPLRSGGRRTEAISSSAAHQQQFGSHEKALAALSADSRAPGMSWRRWALGNPCGPAAAPSAAASSGAAAERSGAAAAETNIDNTLEETGHAEEESAGFGDMWDPLPEETQTDELFQQKDVLRNVELLLQPADALDENLWCNHKAHRRKSVSAGTARVAMMFSSEKARLLRLNVFTVPSAVLGESRATRSRDLPDRAKNFFANRPLRFGRAPETSTSCETILERKSQHGRGVPAGRAAEAPAKKHSNDAFQRPSSSPSYLSGPAYLASAAASHADFRKEARESTEEDRVWQRRSWGGDFTLYTEAELHQHQQREQQDGTRNVQKNTDIMNSSEYVEVLRGIFDSSSMQQRATQTHLTQIPRESDSASSRRGSSRRTSGLSYPSSEPSLEGIPFEDFPHFGWFPSELSENQQQHEYLEAHGADTASRRLRELLQQYASRHLEGLHHSTFDTMPQAQKPQRQESTVPLSKLLPRGRVDTRTACCTFSHLLLLHRHGSIKLEQQPQVLNTPLNNPYPEVYVHISRPWCTSDDSTAEANQRDSTPQQEQQTHDDLQQHQEPRGLGTQSDAKTVTTVSNSEDTTPHQHEKQVPMCRSATSATLCRRADRHLTPHRAA